MHCTTPKKEKEVVILQEFSKIVPKGKKRHMLLSRGRVKPVKLLRAMIALEVKNCIMRAFQDHQIKTFVVLDVLESGHTLIQADEQDINGDSAANRRLPVYL